MKTLIVVPAHNEAGNIENVIEKIKTACPDTDYIVVDDGSDDDTTGKCLAGKYPLLKLPVNLGLAGAFQTGIRYAYENDYDAVIQIDGDGQHEPAFVSVMEREMENAGADIVIGSRFVDEKKPVSARMFGSRLLSFAIRVTTGQKITDPTSGMRAYGRHIIGLLAENINYGPEPDTIAYLMRNGAKVREVQVTMYERQSGKSYLTAAKSARYMINMFMSIFFVQFFRKREVK